jgi:cytosine/adenosine deaminase-related metal-dependent hydrolase
MSSAMLAALRSAFLAQRDAGCDPSAGFEVMPRLLTTNVEMARRFFDEPLLGELGPGAPADVIVIDAPPPTPLDADNLFGHLVYGAAVAPVRHTIARGRVLMQDFHHTTLDLESAAARASRLAPGLWQRFAAIPGGTSFLGE